MDKEKEIEETAKFILKNRTGEDSEWIANGLYNMGYRKADEVRKETAKEFKETMKYIFRFILKNKGNTSIPYFEAEERVFAKIDREVDREFLQKYGVEVDE